MSYKKPKRPISGIKEEDIPSSKSIEWSIEVEAEARIECVICSWFETETAEEDVEAARKGLAARLLDEGWERIDSDKYKVIGWACRKCANTKDEDR